jgi:hypothetical protein
LDIKEYRPAGPTLQRFHESSKFFRLMAGPVGSGKTAGAGCAEMVLGAMIQQPFPDGVRRAKFGVLRDTYRNLYSQFIPSWFEWFPRELGHFVGSDDRPALHTFTAETPLGPCEIQVEMRALGTNTVEKTMRGWNLTGLFIDEADLLPEEVLQFGSGRVKRWPQRPYRVSKGVWGTFNKPDVDHWLYRLCVEDTPDDFEFFDQPGGLLDGGPPYLPNPKAENLERLDDDYYVLQAKNNPPAYVTRMVRNKWGASHAGEVIYPEFNPDLHMLPGEIEPPGGSELILGIDQGGTPAAVIMGRDSFGGRVVYGEVVMVDPFDPKQRRLQHGVGPKRFAEYVKDILHPRFRHCRVSLGYIDPAAQYGADREAGDYSWIETIEQQLGIPCQPAPSNEISLRQDAVRGLLYAAGGPRLRINPSCKWLRRGFTTDYRWEERDPKQPAKTLKPQKSATSHVHDALQYACLGDQGRAGVTGGMAHDRFQPRQSGGFGELDAMVAREARTRATAGVGSQYRADFSPWDW